MDIQFRAFSGPHDWGWVKLHIPDLLQSEGIRGIMAIDMIKNETVACTLFESWTPNSVQAHIIIANPMVLRHKFLEECFDFAFNTAGRKVMIGTTKSDNKKSLKLQENIGFVEKMRIEDGYKDGVDIICMEIRKEDCRFLPQKPKVI